MVVVVVLVLAAVLEGATNGTAVVMRLIADCGNCTPPAAGFPVCGQRRELAGGGVVVEVELMLAGTCTACGGRVARLSARFKRRLLVESCEVGVALGARCLSSG